MTRISNGSAATIAKKLGEKNHKEVQKAHKKLSDKVAAVYRKKISPELLFFFEKFPKYTNVTTHVYIKGGPFISGKYISIDLLPVEYGKEASITNAKDLVVIKGLYDQYETKNTEHTKLVKQIENTLLSLRTYSRIEKEFPEAFKLLNVAPEVKPVTDITALRKKL